MTQQIHPTKIDRDTLKYEYMVGDESSLTVFLRSKGMVDDESSMSGNTREKTQGRFTERNALRKSAYEKGKQDAVNEWRSTAKNAVKKVIDYDTLHKMHVAVIGLMNNKLSKMIENQKAGKDIDVDDMIKIWKVIKAEKFEPTNITRQELDEGRIQTNPAGKALRQIYQEFNPDEISDTIEGGDRIIDAETGEVEGGDGEADTG